MLPDYSVAGDPLETAGVLTHRPLAADRTTVSVVLLKHRADQSSAPVRELEAALLRRARAYGMATRETGTERVPRTVGD